MEMNKTLAKMFQRIADALEIKGENMFKILAYRKVARVLGDLPKDISIYAQEDTLQDIPGIGKEIAEKIKEYLATGKMRKYEEEVNSLPSGLFDLLRIPDVGPRTVKLVYEKMGVKNLDDFKRVLNSGALAELPGMGKKKCEKMMKGIAFLEKAGVRLPIGEALPIAEHILSELKTAKGVKQIAVAGSLRRWKETIGDIDILVTTDNPKSVMEKFTTLKGVSEVLAAGETKATIHWEGRIQVDLRVVEDESYGAALAYFTGSKDHNVKVRTLAQKKGLSLSEYGFQKGDRRIPVRTEEEVYERVGLPYIPPELREDAGEVEAALAGDLPHLLEMKDIRGDVHVHSNYSDGTMSVAEVAEFAAGLHYEYVALTDHSGGAKYAHGVEPERLKKQWAEVDALNHLGKIHILKGAEVDINSDGSLDYPDEILRQLDFVIVSIHQWSAKDTTPRILQALRHPLVHGFAHPTGRLIGKREPYPVDLTQVMKVAAEYGKFLELNAHFMRLDLNDVNLREAFRLRIPIFIGTDTHTPGEFALIRFGVHTARRAWLEPSAVLNSYPLPELLQILRHSRP